MTPTAEGLKTRDATETLVVNRLMLLTFTHRHLVSKCDNWDQIVQMHRTVGVTPLSYLYMQVKTGSLIHIHALSPRRQISVQQRLRQHIHKLCQ